MNHVKKATSIMQKQGYVIKKIVERSKGCDHKILLLYTNKGNFVYRYCKNPKAIMSHAYCSKVWNYLPKPIIIDTYFLIETKIPGREFTKHSKVSIMKEVGKALKQMHRIKTQKYGYLEKPGVGQCTSWKEFILGRFKQRLTGTKRALGKELLDRLTHYVRANEYLLNYHTPVLLHQDMNPDNIMIQNGHLSGIIDAADALSGDPAYEISVLYDRFRNYPKKYPDTARKAYGPINSKRLKYYNVLNALKRIWSTKRQGKDLEKSIKHLSDLLQ